jgi:hypothetical protein
MPLQILPPCGFWTLPVFLLNTDSQNTKRKRTAMPLIHKICSSLSFQWDSSNKQTPRMNALGYPAMAHWPVIGT